MISRRHLPVLPRRPRDAVRGRGRSSATPASTRGSTAARPSSSACRRPTVRSRALPDGVTDEAAVFLADILPTGYGAVVRAGVTAGRHGRRGRLRAGRADGGAVRRGGRRQAHRGRRRRGAAGARGVARRGGGRAGSVPVDAVAAATDGLGADVVIEAAGTPGGLDAALRLARGRGVVSVVGAHFEPDYPLDNALMFERELTLRFSIGDPTADGRAAAREVAAGKLDPSAVVTHRMPLADAAEAYRCSTRARRQRWCSVREARDRRPPRAALLVGCGGSARRRTGRRPHRMRRS